VLTAENADRNLLERDAPAESLDQELGSVKLGLAQVELGQYLGLHRTKAVGAVGDPNAGENPHQAIEERDPQLASKGPGLGAAEDT